MAVSPSTSRNALWTMWVAVCAREIARAARDVDLADRASSPTCGLAVDDRDRGARYSPGTGCWTSYDLEQRAVGQPDQRPASRELAAALGVERGAVEHDLDVLARPARPLADRAVHEQAAHAAPR